MALLVMSLLLPGSAQLLAGNRTVGKAVLGTWLAILATGIVLVVLTLTSISAVVGVVSSPTFLFIAQWGLFAWAAIWAGVVIDAWRLGRPDAQPAQTRRRFALATALLMVIPGTVAYAGASVAAGRDALASVFTDGDVADSTQGRFNILLLGADSGDGREGLRPDSLQLVSVDAETGRAVTFGFTRDTANIVFERGSVMADLLPDGWACGDECLLNALYTWGWDNKDQFPPGTKDPGMLATREAIEALSGLDVHYYALVDLNGFRDLVDALGGLEITVMRQTPIGGGTSKISGYIEPGTQTLDGHHALWYARSRAGSSNYERMARQRCVMSAMANQVDPRTLALNFGGIAEASTGVLRTDIPQSELGRFAELAMKTRDQKITGVNFVPPVIRPWDYEVSEIHEIVAETIAASEKASAEEAASDAAVALPNAQGLTPADSVVPPVAGLETAPGIDVAAAGRAEPAGSAVLAAHAGDGITPLPETAFDPMASPSEDPLAATDDLAAICTAG